MDLCGGVHARQIAGDINLSCDLPGLSAGYACIMNKRLEQTNSLPLLTQ